MRGPREKNDVVKELAVSAREHRSEVVLMESEFDGYEMKEGEEAIRFKERRRVSCHSTFSDHARMNEREGTLLTEDDARCDLTMGVATSRSREDEMNRVSSKSSL